MSYQASFKKELNRLYTIRWIAQNKYEQEHISWSSKLDLRKNIPGKYLPEIYQTSETLDQLSEPKYDRWVLKPAKGAANRGVYPVIRQGNKWFNTFEKKLMTWQQIIKACKNSEGTKPPYIIEQFIGDKLPYNWEVYCFYGEIGLIRQRQNDDRKAKFYKFYDTDFYDLGLIEPSKKDILRPSMPLPNHAYPLLDAAKEISLLLKYPFVRLDFYDTDKIYLGEVTMHPGIGNNFIEEWDKKLGKMWLDAEARLQ
jgi:hypothetical protein